MHELDSYLYTFGEAQKTLTIFSLSKTHAEFSQMFFLRAMLGLAVGKMILDK